MKIILTILTLSSLAIAAERPPNIVVILGDDQAWTEYGFMGHPEIRTPHLDKLAARSLVFERGYVASPLCQPSLASMLTGRFPQQHGVTHSIHNMTPGDPNDTLQYLWCVEDEWKLIVRHHGRDTTRYRNVHLWDKAPVRLYRIRDDPQEKRDLAARHPEVVERLRGKIAAWHPVNGN